MIAHHGLALAEQAALRNAPLKFEAAVAGGIPVVKGLREGAAANRIERIYGILNGTCNFILTTMKESGRGFDDVLAEAQALGYAETPPDLDVDGIDTAHKLALVAAVATGSLPSYDGVYTEGIRSITGEDVKLADELGFSIKLLGIASRIEPFEGDPGFEEDPFRPCVGEEAPDVHGKVGGFLGNRKANAGLLLQGVAELLDRDFELRDGIVTDKAVYSRPAADDIIDDLAERCDFVVTAIAD